jgi:hypothetical protein
MLKKLRDVPWVPCVELSCNTLLERRRESEIVLIDVGQRVLK